MAAATLPTAAQYQATPVAQQDPATFRQIILAAAGAGAAQNAATAPAGALTVVAGTTVHAGADAVILAALLAFLARKRKLDMVQLRATLISQAQAVHAANADWQSVLQLEETRAAQFSVNTASRVRAALPAILSTPDPQTRANALQVLLDREARFERQHVEAMFARALAGLNRIVVKAQSPLGAFWALRPGLIHCPLCLAMAARRIWPWEVLDRIHPRCHQGCGCELRSLGAATAAGLIAPGEVPDVAKSEAAAAPYSMELGEVCGRHALGLDRDLALVG